MRHLWLAVLLGGAVIAGCVRNPVGPGPSGILLNNVTTYNGVIEQPSPDVLFSPGSVTEVATSFGGPIQYSWGGASLTTLLSTAPTAVAGNGPSSDIWIKTGTLASAPGPHQVIFQNGIGGPSGNLSLYDYYIRWAGFKGPNASLDYSSMSMYIIGSGIPYDLTRYKGFLFYARGHGNFEVTLSGNSSGVPYSALNFYSYNFGPSLTGDDQWHEYLVQFTDMIQTYGQAADLNGVLKQCYGLQFDQLAPLTPNFQLDVDYVRFF
jgi:hypothetical protein